MVTGGHPADCVVHLAVSANGRRRQAVHYWFTRTIIHGIDVARKRAISARCFCAFSSLTARSDAEYLSCCSSGASTRPNRIQLTQLARY